MEFNNYYLIAKVEHYDPSTTLGIAINANNPISFINPKGLKLKKGNLIGMHILEAHYPAICDQKIKFFKNKSTFQKYVVNKITHVGTSPNHKHGILRKKINHIEIEVKDKIIDHKIKKVQPNELSNYNDLRKLKNGTIVHCQLQHKILGKIVWVTEHKH